MDSSLVLPRFTLLIALLLTTIGAYDSLGAVVTAYDTVVGTESIFSLVYFCLSLFTTLYCTIGIIARIVSMSRANNISLTSYRGVLEIVVESALIYAVVLVIHVILYFISARWGAYYSSAILTSVTVSICLFVSSRHFVEYHIGYCAYAHSCKSRFWQLAIKR